MSERFQDFLKYERGELDWRSEMVDGQRLEPGPGGIVAFFPGLSAEPWPNFRPPCTEVFKEKRQAIVDEVLLVRDKFRPYGDGGNAKFHIEDPSMWAQLPVLYSKVGITDEAREKTPTLARIFEDSAVRDECINSAVSVLKGHGDIPPHNGPSNFWILGHFGLVVPNGCTITAGGETHPHIEGDWIFFNDSFKHSASNPSDETRIVFIVSFWHPELSLEERELLKAHYAKRWKTEAGSGESSKAAK